METLPWKQCSHNLCPPASEQPSSLAKAITSSIKLSAHQEMTNETRSWHFPFLPYFSGKKLKICWNCSTRYPYKPLDPMCDHSKTQRISSKEPNVLMETTQLAQNHDSTTKWTTTEHKLNGWEERFSEKRILLWLFIPDPYRKFMKYLQNQFGELKSLVPLKLKTMDYTEPLVLWPYSYADGISLLH